MDFVYCPVENEGSLDISLHINQFRYESVIQSHPGLTRLIVRFSKYMFLRPHHITVLGCLIEEYHQNGVRIKFELEPCGLSRYLNNIRFFEYWNSNTFNRNRFTNTLINTALCLWHISEEMYFDYANRAKHFFQDNHFEGFSLDFLTISLGEIFNNIYDHSMSEIDGYAFTQYYPNEHQIKISVCDFGKGIPVTINEFRESNGEDLLSSEECLEMALRRGFTTKSTPSNKGLGLDTLSSITNSLSGRLFILSNDAVAEQNPNQLPNFFPQTISFPGTLISMELDTRHLPEREDIIEDDEFNF